MKARVGGAEISLCSFFNLNTRCGGWLMPPPRPFHPGNNPVPIEQEADWALRVWKMSSPLVCDPPTVQPVASRFKKKIPMLMEYWTQP